MALLLLATALWARRDERIRSGTSDETLSHLPIGSHRFIRLTLARILLMCV
jgi:hypothetical protein